MKLKVLLVDDAVPLLQLMTVVLRRENFQVITAEDGERALGLLETEEPIPDLVLLDIVMPGLDGFEVCRKIKERVKSKIKVILYTGQVDAIDNAEARQSGADGLAVKTGDYEDILEKIYTTLQTSP